MAKTVSFYSYKGGVGRSMILANVAVLLAQRGRRVVCIDFDLEASGLHTIFDVQLRNNLDLIAVLLGSTTDAAILDLSPLVPDCPKNGKLWLLPTLSENRSLQDLSELGTEYLPTQIKRVIDEIVGSINPHFILMDCRTGITDTSYLGLQQGNALVCVLRPNKQNVDGIKKLLDVIERKKKPNLLVVSQVPAIPHIEQKLAMLEQQIGGEPPRRFGVNIPLLPELALGEEVAAISMPLSSALDSYRMVADWIDGLEVSSGT